MSPEPLTLSMSGYVNMARLRPQFDAWLKAEGLKDELIFEATFGEGVLNALCYKRNAAGDRYLVQVGADRLPATERKTFRLRTPPPAFVYDYCGGDHSLRDQSPDSSG